MAFTTYSFLDLSGAITHALVGSYIFTGEGVGSVTITMSTEKTSHDVAADGVVMISKVAGNNGQVAINCQQTSEVHKWLLKWYNLILAADTGQWAGTAMTLRNTNDGSSHYLTGVSPSKIPDKPYQAQGQRITWTLMAGEIINLPIG